MIVKIGRGGKSFKGLSEYLTHDPKARTDERVDWTHTHNLANDHVPSAVDEMVWTARHAELLKQEAGVRAGGRMTEYPVKEVSLDWSTEDKPTCEHMIGTSEVFLRHMGWQEHQVVMIAHNDKSYAHVHLMINVVHPETGRHLNDGLERRRAQEWALAYEREQGRIYCEQRLLNPEERQKSPPRNIWMQFQKNQKEFQRAEQSLSENQEIRENPKNSEWKILKEYQRNERQEFFAQGKKEFSELRAGIYREVREEFRGRWSEYYEQRKNGGDPESLSSVKAQISADQKAALEPRREAACLELRHSRDERYRGVLERQAEIRADLKWHQETGLDPAPLFLELAERKDTGKEMVSEFQQASQEITASTHVEDRVVRRAVVDVDSDGPSARQGPGLDVDVGGWASSGLISFADSLFFDLTTLGGGSTNPKPRSNAEIFQAAADETQKRQQHELDLYDEDSPSRQRVLHRE